MSWGKMPRKFRGAAVSAALPCPLSDRLTDALRARYGALRHGHKTLARAALATPRAAENWLSGECAPRLAQVIEIMAADPEIEAVVLGLVRGRRAERTGE